MIPDIPPPLFCNVLDTSSEYDKVEKWISNFN